tara:strand:- start:1850 stop:2938 length:1089 start_codon:yes stop_codon:yes gene_type:complete
MKNDLELLDQILAEAPAAPVVVCPDCLETIEGGALCECGHSRATIQEDDAAREAFEMSVESQLAEIAERRAQFCTDCELPFVSAVRPTCACGAFESLDTDDEVTAALVEGQADMVGTYEQDENERATVTTAEDVQALFTAEVATHDALRFLSDAQADGKGTPYSQLVPPSALFGGPTVKRPGQYVARKPTPEVPESVHLVFVERFTLEDTTLQDMGGDVSDDEALDRIEMDYTPTNPFLSAQTDDMTAIEKRNRQAQTQVVLYRKEQRLEGTDEVTVLGHGLAYCEPTDVVRSTTWEIPGPLFYIVRYDITRTRPNVSDEEDATWREDIKRYNRQFLTTDASAEAMARRPGANPVGNSADAF